MEGQGADVHGGHAAVDREHRARDVGRLGGGQEQRRGGDLVRLRRPAQGDVARDLAVGRVGVRTEPGQIAFARTPRGPSVTASDFVSITSAAFETAYWGWPGQATSAATDETFTIEPPRSARPSPASSESRWAAVRLTDMVASQSASPRPALFTSTSSGPVCSSALRRSSGSATSPAIGFPPLAASASRRRPIAHTVAPSAANRRTIAAPMPLPPPVTSAVRPSRRTGGLRAVVCVAGRPPHPFAGGVAALALEPLLGGGLRRSAGAARRRGRGERVAHERAEALGGEAAVAVLAAPVLGDDAQSALGVEPRSQPPPGKGALGVGQGGAPGQVEHELDPRGRRVHVLAAGAAAARRPE